MAKKPTKDAFYFSHDSNARNDPKIMKLRRLSGLEGVGLYWCIVEMLRETKDYKLRLDDVETIVFELRCDEKVFKQILASDLFVHDNVFFWSNSLNNRMKIREKINKKRSENGRLGGLAKASKSQASANQMPSKDVANVYQERKGKERKGNKSKGNSFTPPTLTEVKEYCTERRNSIDSQRFLDFYESKGWMIGKNKMKSWKAAVRNWERETKQEPKTKQPALFKAGFTLGGD